MSSSLSLSLFLLKFSSFHPRDGKGHVSREAKMSARSNKANNNVHDESQEREVATNVKKANWSRS